MRLALTLLFATVSLDKLMRSSTKKLLVLIGRGIGRCVCNLRFGGTLHGASFSGAKLVDRHPRTQIPTFCCISMVAIYGCYALRALRWGVFQQNLGASNFWPIYGMTLAASRRCFCSGARENRSGLSLLARKEKLPVADMYGIYALERIFDVVSAAVIAGIALLVENRHVPVAQHHRCAC